MAALLGACTSLPPPPVAPLADLPGRFAGEQALSPTGALPAALWWQRWDDPLLARLADDAVRANSQIGVARAAWQQALALRDADAAGLGPTLDARASAQRARSSGSTANQLGAGLDAAWQPLADRSGLRAADASAAARAASLADVQLAIATTLGLAYIDLRGSQARLAIAQASLDSQRQTQQIVAWRLEAGLVTQLEAEQAATAVAQTEAQLPLLALRIAQNAHALAVLSGRPPAALIDTLGRPAALPRPAADLALSLPADTLRQRPDVLAAQRDWQAAAQRVAQADAARRPQYRLSGSLGLNALTLSGLSAGSALAVSALAGVNGPLFDGGAARAQVRAQQAAYDSAGQQYRGTVLAALQAVEDALVALRDNRARLARLQQAAASAGRAEQLAQQRFRSGLVDFQTVLDTQRSTLATQDSVASAQAEISADHMRLFQALGGGWQPDGPATATAPSDRQP